MSVSFVWRRERDSRRHWDSVAASPGGPSEEGLLPLRLPQGKIIFPFHWMFFLLRCAPAIPFEPLRDVFYKTKTNHQMVVRFCLVHPQGLEPWTP